MKYSHQRELVLHAVTQSPLHPTADNVYSYLRRENPNISLGTVYRNLGRLTETGLIRKIPVPHGGDRFDGRLDEHYHMVCEQCGGIFDVELESLRVLDRQIEQATGFTVTGHELIVSGICNNCNNHMGDS